MIPLMIGLIAFIYICVALFLAISPFILPWIITGVAISACKYKRHVQDNSSNVILYKPRESWEIDEKEDDDEEEGKSEKEEDDDGDDEEDDDDEETTTFIIKEFHSETLKKFVIDNVDMILQALEDDSGVYEIPYAMIKHMDISELESWFLEQRSITNTIYYKEKMLVVFNEKKGW